MVGQGNSPKEQAFKLVQFQQVNNGEQTMIQQKFSPMREFDFSSEDVASLVEAVDGSIEIEVTEVYRIKPTIKTVTLQPFSIELLEVNRVKPNI